MKKSYIGPNTRFSDGNGGVWRVHENLYFGRWLCAREDRPGRIGDWTSNEIRDAISANGALEDGESFGYHIQS